MKKTKPKFLYQGINDWYESSSGQHLIDDIERSLGNDLSQCFGYYAVQIGCPAISEQLVKKSRVRHQFVIDSQHAEIIAPHENLPIANDSVDLVIAAHCLAYSLHPHALLREIDRIMMPEAKLILIEFNPLSLWGLRHNVQAWLEKMPWTGHLLSQRRLSDWLSILGFKKIQMIKSHYDLPIQSQSTLGHWVSKAIKRWLPFMSAVNILIYEKSITPMTPIKSRWQQKILNASPVASAYVGRQSNK